MYYKAISILITIFFVSNSYSQPSQEEINQSREFFNKGVQYGVNNEFQKSLEAFNNAIEINPIYAKAFLYRGLTKTELHDYKDAIKDFTITIELDPGYSDQAHYFRGLAKYKKSDYEAAIRDFSIAIRLNPDFVSFFQRGKAYLKLKEYGRALQDFDISYRLNPEFQDIHLYRGQALYYVGQYQSAIEDLDIAKQLMPDNPEAYYYSGLTRIAMQNSYVAIEDLDKCIEMNPNYGEAYLARARAKKNTGNHQAAHADEEKAKTLLAKAETDDKTVTLTTKDDPAEHETSSETLDIAKFFSSDTRTKPSAVKDVEEDIATVEDKVEVEAEPELIKEKPAAPETTAVEKKAPDITQLSSGFYNKMLNNTYPKGFGVQVASYSNTDNLQNLVNAYEEQFEKPVFINVNHLNGQKIYRIIIGQFNNRDEAESFRDNLRQNHFSDCFLIVFERLH